MNKLKNILKDEKGLGVVEIGLIILVIIALVVIFKAEAGQFIRDIFKQTNVDTINEAPDTTSYYLKYYLG